MSFLDVIAGQVRHSSRDWSCSSS